MIYSYYRKLGMILELNSYNSCNVTVLISLYFTVSLLQCQQHHKQDEHLRFLWSLTIRVHPCQGHLDRHEPVIANTKTMHWYI